MLDLQDGSSSSPESKDEWPARAVKRNTDNKITEESSAWVSPCEYCYNFMFYTSAGIVRWSADVYLFTGIQLHR